MNNIYWDSLDRQALSVIRLMLAHNITFNVIKEKTTAGLINALPNMYKKPFVIKRVYLMQCLFYLKMGEEAYVVDHVTKFNVAFSQLSLVKIDLMMR